jgi:membrane-associated phospholipid phosphatase
MKAALVCVAWLVLVGGCARATQTSLDAVAARLDVLERREHRAAEPGRTSARLGLRAPVDSAWEQSEALKFRLAAYRGTDVRAGDSTSSFSLTVAENDEDGSNEAAATSADGHRTPLPSFWETLKRDVKAMPADLWKDTKAVYGSAPNLIILGATYGGMLAVQGTGPDRTVEEAFRDRTVFSKDARDIFGALGNPGTHFALAGVWYLLGQQQQDEKTYEVGRTLFSALIINGLSTLAGQAATWDRGPNGEWGAFPSGHTSSTFTFASVMHEAYGPLVGFPLYGLGVLVAMERLEDEEHYLSDVIMGGVMGLVIGHTVAGEHKLELFGGEVVPYASPHTGSSGIAWVTHFH